MSGEPSECMKIILLILVFLKALLEMPFVLKASPSCGKHIVRVSKRLFPQEVTPAPAPYIQIEARASLPFFLKRSIFTLKPINLKVTQIPSVGGM